MEEYNEKLKNDLKEAQAQIDNYSRQIQDEHDKKVQNVEKETLIKQLEPERNDLRKLVDEWSARAGELESENAHLTKVLAVLEDMPATQIFERAGTLSEPLVDTPAGPLTTQLVQEHWQDFLRRVRVFSKMTEALLRDSEILSVKRDQITIGFLYISHKERIDKDPKAKPLIERILTEILGVPVKIRTELSPRKAKMRTTLNAPSIETAIRTSD